MLKYYILKSEMVVDTYCNLIPVIIIAMMILYGENVSYIAHTPLGKFVAILLIVYYTSMDVLYGLLMCALVILYYYSDIHNMFKENFSTIESVKDFKNQNCKNGELQNKGSPVRLEMIEHIHPDIKFKYEKCNPCLDTCEFSIIEEQINAEEKLKPKTSDDFSLTSFFDKIGDFIPALRVKSEPFATFVQ